MERLHRSCYKFKIEMLTSFLLLDPKKVICFKKNPDPFQNFRYSDVTHAAPALTLVLNMDQKKNILFLILRRFFLQ
jgi:hypothetical protein